MSVMKDQNTEITNRLKMLTQMKKMRPIHTLSSIGTT